VYGQATYQITKQFNLTGGIRYTSDTTKATAQQITYDGFPGTTPGAPTNVKCINSTTTTSEGCTFNLEQKSHAPTWLIDLDYIPNQGQLLYAKYARGYRQGSVAPFAAEKYNTYEPEHVDAYEVGSKSSFAGAVPGIFNVAVFYNELRDQQLQAGFNTDPPGKAPATTGIVNAGKSTIEGVEVATTLALFRDLSLDIAYTYLDTEVKQATAPQPFGVYNAQPTVTADVGGPLPQSPKHKASATATYRLPLSQSIGNISIGATYVYTSKQNTTSPSSSPFATLDPLYLLNLNLDWRKIANSSFDASVFATNVTNREYYTYVSGLYNVAGFEVASLGQPRMWGMRLRYNFGK
jgi:iron complex outermembrane receptor protein